MSNIPEEDLKREALTAALQLVMQQKWISIDKDNMEFQCTTTCFVLDKIRDALAASGAETSDK